LEKHIEISNLTHVFGTHTVLEDISLDIDKGEFISVVGPNGGGKSTLFKLLLGLVQPAKGSVRINGISPNSKNSIQTGYVPQLKTADRSFPALAIELVASGIKSNWVGRINRDLKNQCLAAMEKVNAVHLADKSLSGLSGGELQRIYLARSIARQPQLLLLDEPATGIDTASEKDLNKIMDNIRKDSLTTVIMATHDWESAYHHSDKVLILNKKVICYDVPDKAFSEEALRVAFGHEGHKHEIIFGTHKH